MWHIQNLDISRWEISKRIVNQWMGGLKMKNLQIVVDDMDEVLRILEANGIHIYSIVKEA